MKGEFMSKNIAAFFDIDGTIYRDSLLIEHFKMLLKYEYINMMSWESKVKEKFLKWENRTGDYDDYLDELVRTYMEALKNFNKDEMLKDITEIENLAFQLEINENFKNFNSFVFLKRYNENKISEKEFETFLKMCFYDTEIQKAKERERKKIKKGR